MKSFGAKIALALSILCNVLLAYAVIDGGITTTHQAEALRTRQRQLETVLAILDVALHERVSRTALHRLVKMNSWELVQDRPSEVSANGVVFHFQGTKLERVELVPSQ